MALAWSDEISVERSSVLPEVTLAMICRSGDCLKSGPLQSGNQDLGDGLKTIVEVYGSGDCLENCSSTVA